MPLHQLIQQRGLRAMAGVTRRIEKWRRAHRARVAAYTVDVPATGGEATDYGATDSSGLANPGVFEQKCCRRKTHRRSSFGRFFSESLGGI